MKRRTVTLSPKALDALERLARAHDTNVSCVVEAAGSLASDGGPALKELERRIMPDRRGGRRVGAGTKSTRALPQSKIEEVKGARRWLNEAIVFAGGVRP